MSQYLPPQPERLEKIDHIVVLMLENRSFDNLLGWLYETEEPPSGQSFEGLDRSVWNPFDNIDPDGIRFVERVGIRKNGEPARRPPAGHPATVPVDFTLPNPDPGEGFRDTNFQLFGGLDVPDGFPPTPLNQGFVNNYADAMRYSSFAFGDRPTDPRDMMVAYTPEQLPVLSGLARAYAVCDHWHCSVPSQTLPNRAFVHAATSDGLVNNSPAPNFSSPTIFNRIQDRIDGGATDLSWAVYSGTESGDPFSLTRLMMRRLHDRRLDDNFLPIQQLRVDAANGALKSYSFIEPQFHPPGQNDQHPNADVRPGEALIADVYDILTASPCWDRTMLVVTYDEHGGCFDHVAPPRATPPTWLSESGDDLDGPDAPPVNPLDRDGPAGQMGFRFNRFGLRVPTVVVSPLVAPGIIGRPKGFTPFDHTSIIATVRNRFDLGPPLTKRDAHAPDLSCLLTLDQPREDVVSLDAASAAPSTPAPAASTRHLPNDLHRFSAELLRDITKRNRPDDVDEIEWSLAAYAAHFSTPRHAD